MKAAVLLRMKALLLLFTPSESLRLRLVPSRSAVMMADRVFSSAEAKGGINPANDKTALLFIEYQNEFTSPGGKLHDAVAECMQGNSMLEKSAALAKAARAAGVKIFHAPIMFKEDASDNPNKNLGILAGCAADQLFTEGTWNADFHESMQPEAGDVVVQGKCVGRGRTAECLRRGHPSLSVPIPRASIPTGRGSMRFPAPTSRNSSRPMASRPLCLVAS